MAAGGTWHILTSTVLRAVAYDERTRQLRVKFASGSQYRYYDVPAEVVERLVDPDAGSPGRYFNEHVRDSYDFDEETP